MSTAAIFLIDGVEETEAVTTIDILRRGGVMVASVSLNQNLEICGKHKINFSADILFNEAQNIDYEMLIIPGGTMAYLEHQGLLDLVQDYAARHKKLAAICAAPALLGRLGLLKGLEATIFPSMEEYIKGAKLVDKAVVTSANITTSRGPGTAPFFALELLKILEGQEQAAKIAKDFQIDFLQTTMSQNK